MLSNQLNGLVDDEVGDPLLVTVFGVDELSAKGLSVPVLSSSNVPETFFSGAVGFGIEVANGS